MTLWKNLVVALVAAFVLAACSSGSGSSEMTPQERCEAGGGTYADGECTTAAEMKLAEQKTAISNAIGAAETAVAGVNDDSTNSEVSAAEMAVAAARKAIADATDVPVDVKAANTGTVDAIANRLMAAKTSRMAAMDAAEEQRKSSGRKTWRRWARTCARRWEDPKRVITR